MSYGCRQKFAQPEPRFVDLGFRSAFADAEDRPDFLMLKSFDVVEQKCGPGPFRQPRDCPLEIEFLDIVIFLSRLPAPSEGPAHPGSMSQTGSSLPALQMVQAPVHRQAIQPCSDGRIAAEIGQLLVDQKENLLQQILSVCPRTAHPPGQIEQPRRVLLVQFVESRTPQPVATR